MYCHILKDKSDGTEYLIPGCYCVAHNWGVSGMTDREIIKTYCCCVRKKVEKYQVQTRDEVFSLIEKLEAKIQLKKNELSEIENELDCIKSEVFMLNAVEVDNIDTIK